MGAEPESSADHCVVVVQPIGVEVIVPAGQRLMIAAQEQGLQWPSVCGGKARCGICLLTVTAGEPPARTEHETNAIAEFRGQTFAAEPAARLACQLRPTGDLEVQKLGVRIRDE